MIRTGFEIKHILLSMKLFLSRTKNLDSGLQEGEETTYLKKEPKPKRIHQPKIPHQRLSPCSKIILAGWNIKPATINFTPCIPKADAEW